MLNVIHTASSVLRSARSCVTRALGVSLALAAAVTLTPSASAQFGGQAGFGEAFKAEFLNRDMTIFAEMLALEDWQRPIFEALLQDYNQAFTAGLERMKDRLRESTNVGGNKAAAWGPIDDWVMERNRLGEEFLANVKSQLSDAQTERWPKLDRAIRRDKKLHLGELSGESSNLIVLVKELQLAPDMMAALEPALEQYEMSLDQALLNREAVMKSQHETLKQAMVAMDFDAGMAAQDRIMVSRVHVREAQDAGAETIIAALPDASAAKFRDAWRENSYPKVYRGGTISRVFELCLELDDITDEQKQAIAEVQRGYDVQIAALHDQMLTTLRVEEPKDTRRRAEAMRARQNGQPAPARDNDAMQSLVAQREKLNDEARAALEAILGAEKFASIPGARSRPTREQEREMRNASPPKDGGGGAGAPRMPKRPRDEGGQPGEGAPKREDGARGGSGQPSQPQRAD